MCTGVGCGCCVRSLLLQGERGEINTVLSPTHLFCTVGSGVRGGIKTTTQQPLSATNCIIVLVCEYTQLVAYVLYCIGTA